MSRARDPSPPASTAAGAGGALLLGRAVVGVGRLLVRAAPRRLLKSIEDRIFYGVFHTTRVMNDHYGWRPDEPVGYTPETPENQKTRGG